MSVKADIAKAEIDEAISQYLSVRLRFFEVAAKYPNYLAGNDNVIGRIGEYLGMIYLESQGRKVQKVSSPTEKGHDLKEGSVRISVKILTSENVLGRGLRLTEPWDELVLIELDTKSLIYRVGTLQKIEFELAISENSGWSRNPYVKKTMLGAKGLIGRYGRISAPIAFPRGIPSSVGNQS